MSPKYRAIKEPPRLFESLVDGGKLDSLRQSGNSHSEMKRPSVILVGIVCCAAILAESVFSAPSTTEMPVEDAARPADSSKDAGNHPHCPRSHVGHAEATVQAERRHRRDSSGINEGSVEDARRSKDTGLGRRGDAVSRSRHLKGSAEDLSSRDILPDPGVVSTRTARQAGSSIRDYEGPRPSVKSTSGDDVAARRNIGSPRRGSDSKDDIGVAEDRYSRPQYPYWQQRQYPNQRYRANDRRDPYRNYPRYPVFPGR